MIKASTSARPTPAIVGQSSANGKPSNGTAPTSGGLKEIKEVAAKDPRIVVASVPPATEPTPPAPEPQPAPVVAAEPEAPRGPQLSEIEKVLAQFNEMEKLTRGHAKLKAVGQELDQFNFSPSDEVNNPIQLLIKDQSGHQFDTMNVNLIEPLMKYLREVVNGKLVEIEEKLLKYKANL